MFLYELGVEDNVHGRGIGRSLVERLAELARDRGCYGMWVLTDKEKAAALASYEGAGAVREGDQMVLGWKL
jgi:GNAT superfamily N-acetyltransferase